MCTTIAHVEPEMYNVVMMCDSDNTECTGNRIGDEGAKHVAEHLSCVPQLHTLNLKCIML